MEPKYWWAFGIIFMVLMPWLWMFLDKQEFNPESLPPPAAGIPAVTSHNQHACDGIIYSISKDGIEYVRESGGGTLLATELNKQIVFYRLGKFGDLYIVDDAEVDAETSKKLEHALTMCDERHFPSGVVFTAR